MEKSLQQHINDDKNELDKFNTSAQRRRHLESELNDLEQYQLKHPDIIKDPSPLELFCDSNSDHPSCRIHEI